jgi:hypothetical protein
MKQSTSLPYGLHTSTLHILLFATHIMNVLVTEQTAFMEGRKKCKLEVVGCQRLAFHVRKKHERKSSTFRHSSFLLPVSSNGQWRFLRKALDMRKTQAFGVMHFHAEYYIYIYTIHTIIR